MSLLWITATQQTEQVEHIDHIDHIALAEMYSGDYDVPMTQVKDEMRRYYRHPEDHVAIHPQEIEHGGPDAYVAHLKRDIAANGMTEPLTIRGGNVVTDGTHRAVAAMELKMTHIPVRHIR